MKTSPQQNRYYRLFGIIAALVWSAWVSVAVAQSNVNLTSWKQEGVTSGANWNVQSGGLAVLQTVNTGTSTFFVSPDTFIDTTIRGRFGVLTTADDDFVGFVFGYKAPLSANGDPVHYNDFIIFDWKQATQSGANVGFRLRKVLGTQNTGTGTSSQFWAMTSTAAITFTSLGTPLVNAGWADNVMYDFELGYYTDRIIIRIKGGTGVFANWTTIYDVNIANLPANTFPGNVFPEGRFGFYNLSQEQVRYESFTQEGIPILLTNPTGGGTVSIGNVRLGTTGTGAVTISNTGGLGSNLTGTLPALTAPFGGPLPSTDFAVPEGQNTVRTLTFTPVNRNQQTQGVSITSNGGSASLTASGRGVGPTLHTPIAANAPINLGAIGPSGVGSQSIVVNNTTTDAPTTNALVGLTLLSATVAGPDAELFEVVGLTPGHVVAKGGQTSFSIEYTPKLTPGAPEATLTLVTDEGATFGSPGTTRSWPLVDTTGPSAVVMLQPGSPLGPGQATVSFRFSEPIHVQAGSPWFSVSFAGSMPQPLNLVADPADPQLYVGSVTIDSSVPNGPAQFAFSAQDFAGNVGTQITSGAVVVVDKQPPTAALFLNPPSPLKAGNVSVVLTANEPLASAPSLLFAPAGTSAGQGQSVALSGGPAAWTGSVTIDGQTPEGPASFSLVATDLAGNVGTTITTGAQVFVDTTAPAAPSLAASKHPAGYFQLVWNAVPDATTITYRVYRASAPFSTPAEATQVAELSGTALNNQPPFEGIWYYAVLARDAAGNQGPLSAVIEVQSDPPPPEDVTNLLVTDASLSSLSVSWTGSVNSAGLLQGYRLYRDGALVDSVPAAATAYTFSALQSGRAYALKVSTFDSNNRESLGTSITSHTLVANPASLTAVPKDRATQLNWPASSGTALSHYAVYVDSAPFSSVQGLTPAATVPKTNTQTTVSGLTNGQTYWAAVVAVNASGFFHPAVSPVSVIPIDLEPPPAPTALVVAESLATEVTMSWTASTNPAGDLDGYRIKVAGTLVATVPAGQTSYTLTGLSPASAYAVAVSAFDTSNNESTAATRTAHTWLPNPQITAVTGHDRSLKVFFAQSQPSHFVSQYRVYVSAAPIESTIGLQPVATVGSANTQATATGLTNGTTYYVAVAAVNLSSGMDPSVSSQAGVPEDDAPPANPTGLHVSASGATSVQIGWTPSANPTGDLAGYRVYIEGNLSAELAANATSHLLDGLNPASAYVVRVAAFDQANNEGTGATLTAYTWLPHPPGLTITEASHQTLKIGWSHTSPQAYLSGYRVYVSTAPFVSVAGLTPAVSLSASATTRTLTGLANDATYYIAVTAVNKSGGENPAVTTISGSPVPDTTGPALSNLRYAGQPFSEGATVGTDGTISVDATDPAGVSFVRFLVDGVQIGLDSSPSGGWTSAFSVEAAGDGQKELTVEARDALGNSSTLVRNFIVALAPPAPPTITSPKAGAAVNTQQVLVQGSGKAGTTAHVYVGGVEQPGTATVDGAGKFSLLATLQPGTNAIQATLTNSSGTGALSSAVQVTYDNTQLAAPKGLTATASEGGVVKLTWFAVPDTSLSGLKGYRVYRSTAPFTSPSGGTLLNPGAVITTLGSQNIPPQDGLWYYAVAAESNAGTLSELSMVASAQSDATLPVATGLVFTPQGAHDPATGRVGQGPLRVQIAFSEPLLTTPFLSLSIPGAQPVPISLSPVPASSLAYEGVVAVGPNTPSGLATAILSARDLVGNRGTAIQGPKTVLLATQAPSVEALHLTPANPVQNSSDAPTTVQVLMELTEPFIEPAAPLLFYALSDAGPEPQAIPLAQLGPTTYTGGFMLPQQAGNPSEVLQFSYQGTDDLGNQSTAIAGKSSFEVYQGELPALVAPLGLSATAKPAGAIELSWVAVPGAAEYQLYRRAVGAPSFAPLARTTETTWLDPTPSDGAWQYTVASVRSANGQESLSPQSPQAQAVSDSIAPGAPQNLQAALASNGIALQWSAPAPFTEPITYRLYRASGLEITSIQGLTPLAQGLTATLVVDPTPSLSQHAYVVVAADAVGNISPLSNTAYLNPGLLPVASLQIVHDKAAAQPPVVSWTHPSGNLAGYVVSIDGADATTVQPASNFVDALYSSGGRTYGVRAVDAASQESLERSLRLVPVQIAPAPGAELVRGQIAQVEFDVTSAETTSNAVLRVRLDGKDHISAPFPLAAGVSSRVPVVVGGYANLPAAPVATATTRREPNPGERVDVVDAVPLPIRPDTYVAQVIDLGLNRGALGTARFSFTNTGNVPVELLMARQGGNASSDQIRFAVLDGDGNVLATAPVRQSTGGTIALSDGRIVARVMPGDTFSAAPTTIGVPSSAPDSVVVRLTIDNIHYDLGKPTQVTVGGLNTTAPATLAEPPYFATVTSAEPALSFGDQPIVIVGHCVDGQGQPVGGVPVTLVVRVDGFQRTFSVVPNADGQFSYTFVPTANEGGIYEVWAKYPALLSQPAQQGFTIQKVLYSPKSASLSLATGYQVSFGVGVSAGKGTPLSQLRLEPSTLPSGIAIAPPVAVNMAGGSTATVTAKITANSTAPASGNFQLTLRTDDRIWGTIPVSYVRTSPSAQLVPKPTFIETGVVRGGLQMEEVAISNKGLGAAQGVSAELLNAAKTGPAVGWVTIVTGATMGTLQPGETKQISIAFAPPPTALLSTTAPHSFVLRVHSAGKPPVDMPVYAWVNESGEGAALFRVVDMYTGTTNAQGQVVQGLAGAKIKLDRIFGSPLSITRTTDGLGEAFISALPAGAYKWRVSAPGHEPAEGTLNVKPGVTASEEVFLPVPLVTIEWDVTEITIQDKYEIVLSATFETDVPAPVVVVEPPSVKLPAMAVGDVFLGELKVSNYGLIKTQNTSFKLPTGNSQYKFELLAPIPEELAAKSSVVVPYRVTRLGGDAGGGSSGGGCGVSAFWGGVNYGWACINGNWVWAAFPVVFLVVDTSTCPPGGGGGGGGGTVLPPPPGGYCCGGGGSGGGTFSWVGPSWKSQPSAEKQCDPCEHPTLSALDKECCKQRTSQPSNSEVGLITGDYIDNLEDLPVKVLGWDLKFRRRYQQGQWTFDLQDTKMQFKTLQDKISQISVMGATFESVNSQATVFDAGNGIKLFKLDEGPFAWRLSNRGRSELFFDSEGYLLQMRNERGQSFSLERDGSGRIATLLDHNGTPTVAYTYTAEGRIAAIECLIDGRRVEYTWNQGRLAEVVDPAGRITQYTYNTAGLITKKRYPTGKVVNIAYSGSGMVLSVLDDAGRGEHYQYNYSQGTQQHYSSVLTTDGHLVERWFSKDGSLLKTLIDEVEQQSTDAGATSQIDAQGNVTGVLAGDGTPLEQTQYDAQGRVVLQVNAEGLATSFTYTASGLLATEVQRQGVGGPVLQSTTFSYNGLGQLTSQSVAGAGGGANLVTTYEYDAAGQLARTVLPDGTEQIRTYDARGLVTFESDGAGNEVENTYDAIGRLVGRTTVDALGSDPLTEAWAYSEAVDAQGTIIGTRVVYTDPEGRVFDRTIDFNGRTTRTLDPWGRVATYEYNSRGDVAKMTSAEGQTTEVVREVLPTGLRRERWVVDGEDARVQDFDAKGRLARQEILGEETHYFYDGDYPKPAEIVQATGRTLFTYDALGNVTTERHILADGTELEEHHTFVGSRLVSTTNALGHTKTLVATPDGRPAQVVMPSGRTTTISYDPLGRPVTHQGPSGDTSIGLEYGVGTTIARRTLPNGAHIDYEYDAAGRVVGLQTSWGTRLEADLDRGGRATEKRWYAGQSETEPAEIESFAFDAQGRRTLNANSAVSIETSYDDFARTATTTADFGEFQKTFSTFTDSRGRLIALTMPDGTTYSYEYDAFDRVSRVTLPDGAELELSAPAGWQRERVYPNGVTWQWSGDYVRGAGRVQAFSAEGTPLMDWQHTYQGHRLVGISTEQGDYAYEYDQDDQVVAASYPTLAADAYTYDINGQRLTDTAATADATWTWSPAGQPLTAGPDRQYTWGPTGDLASRTHDGQTHSFELDATDRVHLVRDGGGQVVAEYLYDSDGLRVVKKVGASTTYALYGEQGLLAEYDETGAELRRYIWMPGAGWQSGLLVFQAQGQRFYPLLDGQGEVAALTDAAGQIAWQAEFRAFGEAHIHPGATVDFPLRRSGQVFDAETGLHYNTARFYDPKLGRYLSPDPLLEAGGEANLYAFAFNNPVRFEDRLGLRPRVGCDAQMSGLELQQGSCSVTIPVNPAVSIKIELSVSQNKEDCCKDGRVIKDGKGCTEYKIYGGGEVGVDIGGLPSWLGPLDSEIGITAVSFGISGSCQKCTDCGGTDKKFEKCCLAVEAAGPSVKFSTRWFNVSLSTFSITVGQVCYGPGGFSFTPFAGSGPKWGAGVATPKG